LSDAVSRSASRRELANTIVDRCRITSSTIAWSTCGQIDPALCSPVSSGSPNPGEIGSVRRTPSSVMSSTGTTTCSSKVFSIGGATIVTGDCPARKRATSSRGRTVADSPMRWAGFGRIASSRSSDTARCAPRFVAATAWISSTMIVSTPASVSRAALVSIRKSDSGVVIRMSGGSRSSSRRSDAVVSPERTPTVMAGTSRPSRFAVCVMPTRGDRRLRSTSTPRAFSGEM
jgi:hypothetical protein